MTFDQLVQVLTTHADTNELWVAASIGEDDHRTGEWLDEGKAGALLRLKNGSVRFAGHVNINGGVCGCCSETPKEFVPADALWENFELPTPPE